MNKLNLIIILLILSRGSVDFEKADNFQDEIGRFIADAINEKIKKRFQP